MLCSIVYGQVTLSASKQSGTILEAFTVADVWRVRASEIALHGSGARLIVPLLYFQRAGILSGHFGLPCTAFPVSIPTRQDESRGTDLDS